MRVRFSDIFDVNPDGRVRPLTPIHIGALTIGRGDSLCKGMEFGGLDIAALIEHDLEIETSPTGVVLTAVYCTD